MVCGRLVPFLLLGALKFCIALQYPDCSNGPSILTHNLVCNPNAPDAARAAAIVAAMNITEKLANLIDNSPGSARLGLPPYEWWSEALHGVAYSPGVNFSSSGAYSYATSFANPILLSAAFDDDMIQDVATVISTEARAFSNVGRAGLDFFTPNINPYRDPRWGRGMETPGEDPFRIKGYVKNLILGLEGGYEPPIKKIIATCKHYAGYDLEDWDGNVRYGFNAVITSQDLSEYYLPPFQQCARDSRVGSFMCSYNAVNGVPSCANSYLLETILRDHWGWTTDNQWVTSDCNAVQNIYANHIYVQTAAEAAGVAYTAGTDNACEAGYPTDTVGAYNESLLSVATIDEALRRQYQGLVKVGYFDPASEVSYRSISWNDVNTPSSQQLALQSAENGMVLLKNDGLLPLKLSDYSTVALIGMWANATTQMLGGYAGNPPYFHGPLYAATQLGVNAIYADGPIAQNETAGNWTEPAMAAAESADLILYYGGIDLTVEAEAMDRYQISWSPSQVALIEQLSSLGKPMVILQMGDQLDQSAWLQNVNISGIIWCGYPGQSGGTAVFDILSGTTAPAGRLPVTQYPADYVNEVPMTDMTLRPSAANPGRTYKWFPDPVLPFGYGLHYTNFTAKFSSLGSQKRWSSGPSYDIDQLTSGCSAPHLDLCTFPSVAVEITNEGTVSSGFAALVFVNGTYGPQPYPLKSLASYTRLKAINPHETRTASLSFTLGALARMDAYGNEVLYPGSYSFLLDVPTQDVCSFTITGDQKILDEFPQPPPNETAPANLTKM